MCLLFFVPLLLNFKLSGQCLLFPKTLCKEGPREAVSLGYLLLCWVSAELKSA